MINWVLFFSFVGCCVAFWQRSLIVAGLARATAAVGGAAAGAGGAGAALASLTTSHIVSIVAVIAGTLLMLFVASAGTSAWSYIVYVLIGWGILYAVVELNKTSFPLGSASVMHKAIAAAVMVVLFGGPLHEWVNGKAKAAPTTCPDISSLETRSCLLSAVGSKTFTTDSSVVNGMRVCFDPIEVVTSERTLEKGRAYFRLFPKPGIEVEKVRVKYLAVAGSCPASI